MKRYILFERHGPSLASVPFLKRAPVRLESGVRALARWITARQGGDGHDPVGFIDSVCEDEEGLHVRGWLLLGGRSADGIEFETESGGRHLAHPVMRPDPGDAFAHLVANEESGFEVPLPPADLARSESYEFTLHARQGRSIVHHCRVRYRRQLAAFPVEGRAFPPDVGVLET